MGRKKKRVSPVNRWLPNILSIDNGHSGICPYCNSEDTDYYVWRYKNTSDGFIAVWCNSCKKGLHICRRCIPEDLHSSADLPKDISYI